MQRMGVWLATAGLVFGMLLLSGCSDDAALPPDRSQPDASSDRCQTDRDCGRGQVCLSRGRCGDPCELDDTCGGEDPVDVRTDADAEACIDDSACPGGACVDGACVESDVVGDTDTDADTADCVGDACDAPACDHVAPVSARCDGNVAVNALFLDTDCYVDERLDCTAEDAVCAVQGSAAICGRGCNEPADCPVGDVCFSGLCVPGCETDADCLPYESGACTRATCDPSGYCFVDFDRNRQDAPDDIVGDCRRPVCDNGRETWVNDDTDVPINVPFACVEATCEGGLPVQRERNDRCYPGEICSARYGGCVDPEIAEGVCRPTEPPEDPEDPVCGDGINDEGCPCPFGAVQRCYTGPVHTRGVGQCTDGYQTCTNQVNPQWGPCEGQILPAAAEVCDGRDNTCNGCVDDGLISCEEALNCPGNVVAEPLRHHTLDVRTFIDGPVSNVRWTVTPPVNSNAGTPESPNSPQTRFYMDVSGDYLVQVQMVDDKGATVGCSWIVSAQGAGLRVELTWDTYTFVDMDLHLLRDVPGARFCTSDDCYYANCRSSSPNWGYPDSPSSACPRNRCPNPRLDIDNISRRDPENINVDNPNDGDRFRVMVHMYSGSRLTNSVITIYCGGRPAAVYGRAPDLVRMDRSGGGCRGQTWRVADVTMRVDPGTGATSCDVEFLPGSHHGYDVRLNTAER